MMIEIAECSRVLAFLQRSQNDCAGVVVEVVVAEQMRKGRVLIV